MPNIAIYGSHDANICINVGGKYHVYELERITKIRNFNLSTSDQTVAHNCLLKVKELIHKECGQSVFDKCYYAEINEPIKALLMRLFECTDFQEVDHHLAHASCGLYQSNYDECLIISYDAGGKSLTGQIETFCIYHAIKSKGIIKKLVSLPIDVCGAYTMLAIPVSEIHKEDMWSKYLSYAGKKMGLVAYGNVRSEWYEPIKEFYYKTTTLERMKHLGDTIGHNLSDINTLTEQDGRDLCATSQAVFENIVVNAVMPYIHRYSHPIILTGGGALNVLLNQRFKELIKETQSSANTKEFVFVPVNPNDCGLAFGIMALYDQPSDPIKLQYNGIGITDIDRFDEYVNKYGAKKTPNDLLAKYLCEGNTVGVIVGNSEAGARALGNRSILAFPAYPHIKDKLNRVKHREFYRPFAPLVKEDDINKYFVFNGESPYMSFAPKVSVDWYDKVPAVVHKDGTGRVQTVTRENNVFLYQVLHEVHQISGIAMLLNTSFNIKGRPMLTTLQDAFEVLETTELDAVYCNGYLFTKKK